MIRAVPSAGGRAQGGDERLALLLVCALGEQLLELIDHQQQLLRWLLPGCCRAVRIPSQSRWRGEGGLAGGEREPGWIGVQPSPHCVRVGSRQRCHSQRQLV